jgi:tetratricopeptide (TPR) repeat protein
MRRPFQLWRRATRLNPRLWGAELFLGVDYYRTNQFGKALGPLLAAQKLQPEQPEVRFWLGVTHVALKHYLEGEEILEALSAEQPRNAEVLRVLAQSYSDYAVALHNRVVAEHPESAWAHCVHGQALENEGYFEAAAGEYRKAAALRPQIEGIEEDIARVERAGRKSSAQSGRITPR